MAAAIENAPVTATPLTSRRQFLAGSLLGGAALCTNGGIFAADKPFRLNYILASCMYGTAPLATILPHVRRTGAEFIEIWAAPHGNQREQIDELGVETVKGLLAQHDVKLGSFTCFKYGIFNMQGEMELVGQLGGDLVICNTPGPKDLQGAELKAAVREFATKLEPHVAAAERLGLKIGVENHGGGVISSRDSILWLMEMIPSQHLGLAMAPYHLPQETQFLSQLIRSLGDRLVHFQAWEHGMGCMTKLPKEQEMLQLPHRGPLDWQPLLMALKEINYQGRTEIFMHPVPRGIPILETPEEVTQEINAARDYLQGLLV